MWQPPANGQCFPQGSADWMGVVCYYLQMANGETLSEVEIDQRITGFRAKQAGFKQCSFDTIAGEGVCEASQHPKKPGPEDVRQYEAGRLMRLAEKQRVTNCVYLLYVSALNDLRRGLSRFARIAAAG
eukprot:scaffold306507_cov47-Prasinocladus_malaysianus.AAC.3